MIGGLSSSLATAVRTAGEARQRMDTAAHQIATGQRVSSVKDDAATWVRADGLRRESRDWDWRASEIRRYQGAVDLTSSTTEQQWQNQTDALNLLRQAQASAPGSAERRQLVSAWDDLQARDAATRLAYQEITNQFNGQRSMTGPGGEWVIDPWGADDAFLDPLQIPDAWWATAQGYNLAGYSPTLYAISTTPNGYLNASAAQLTGAINELVTGGASLGRTNGTMARVGASAKRFEMSQDTASKASDRTAAAAGALTDADLGQASTQLRQNEARQQLALQTVRSALNAYGAYAGGLLGNVQKTQRALA